MSYRALITVTDGTTSRDFIIPLDEDFKNGEERANQLSGMRCFYAAYAVAQTFAARKTWDSDIIRDAWMGTYADQVWTVAFEEDGEFSRCKITGLDANAEMIFFRATTYHIGS